MGKLSKKIRFVLKDTVNRWLHPDDLTPPQHTLLCSGKGMEEQGNEFLRYFIDLGGLTPDGRVLDVGSGIGRMAIPLTKYLSPAGRYDGFEIMALGVDWCRKRITPRHPNFRFQQADVHNELYNPGGKILASEYRFPYGDGSFDLVFLTSIFTHMLPADMENYLREISRVLSPGGKCLITFFLLETPDAAETDPSRCTPETDMKHRMEGYWTSDRNRPEIATGYSEKRVRDLFGECGLAIEEPIRYGSWNGRRKFLGYQDMVIGRKIHQPVFHPSGL